MKEKLDKIMGPGSATLVKIFIDSVKEILNA